MTISRRNMMKVGLAAGAALSLPSVLRAQTAPSDARTVRWVPDGILQVFDPLVSTANETSQHSLAIYDTLFALDSKGLPQPQMVEKWGLSDDKKTYTFHLREGQAFHDGSPVTAADCVASVRRWGQADAGGKVIMESVKDISKNDDRTFTITLTQPLPLLIPSLASAAGLYLAVMREKDASRPVTEQVTANIGSGPFKFNEALARPGASFVYDRNENYVPRKEAPDGFAGGKVVNVDRVIWNYLADQQTAFAALQAGEVDLVQAPASDLYPAIESDPNLELEIMNKAGTNMFLRLNCLQPPFNNVKARQAMLHLIDQEAVMRAAGFDPKYINPVTSIFGRTTPYSNDENTGWYKKGGDLEGAKQLFQEAGYAGEKVVVLQTSDWPAASNAALYLANTLRKIGVNAELASSDWSGFTARRSNKGPVEDGGWSIFISDWSDSKFGNPLDIPALLANGDDAWYGWPKNDEYEALRAKWGDVDTLQERQALAREMQRLSWDFVGTVMLGHYVSPVARRKSLTGLVSVLSVVYPMWNMQKA
ncbi:Dipeptide-binding protein DppE [Ensifer psoraleae]|uniref:ABC transporter substrate-binding protein n=1 Tax=Sinorhizobium psoraleae TaxID=520838 RepID=UPI0015691556|nr:ABC transporter substrate-binding protein [Sinorhizobium psoraleae]NRP75639.1 Dipeptide-binding protein DppE [Sinorhizobium psoraleae]